jgi:hypothetical protein
MHTMTQHDEQGVGAEDARAIDPGEYREHFHREFRFAAYYSAGRERPGGVGCSSNPKEAAKWPTTTR